MRLEYGFAYLLRVSRAATVAGLAGRLLLLFVSFFLTGSYSFAHHEPPDRAGNSFPDHSYYRTVEAARSACTSAQPLLGLGGLLAPGYDIFPSAGCGSDNPAGPNFAREYYLCHVGLDERADCFMDPNSGIPVKAVFFISHECPYPDLLLPSGEAEPRDCKPRKCSDCTAGNPIDVGTGNKREYDTDFSSPNGLLTLSRSYNSMTVAPNGSTPSTDATNGMGGGWLPPMHARLLFDPRRTNDTRYTYNVYYIRDDGTGALFVGGTTDPDIHLTLEQSGTGYAVVHPGGAKEQFDLNGGFMQKVTPNGETVQVTLGGGPSGAWPTAVTDPFGHQLTYTYNNGRLTQATDPSGATYTYAYDTQGNLTSVTYPDGSLKQYLYENANFPHHLTGIIDENGVRISTYQYDNLGRGIATEHAVTDNGAAQEKYILTYGGSGSTTVTDPQGQTRSVQFEDDKPYDGKLTNSTESDGKTSTNKYDANRRLIESTDLEGHKTRYSYNAAGQKVSKTQAADTPQARTTTYTYLSDSLDLPTVVASPSIATGQQKQTLTTYDNQNRPITLTQTGFRPDGTPVSRTVSMQYNANGQIIQIDGARTDVADITTLAYYTCTTGAGCGQLQSVANALGHVTTYDTYDAAGRVTQQTDTNGTQTQYTYDPRGRVKTVTQAPPVAAVRTTTYTYDATGQLLQTSLPDGMTLTYTYDVAHYLRSVTDNLGNKAEYTYDLKGRRTQELTKDPDGTLVRSLQTAYDVRDKIASINTGGSLTQQLHDGSTGSDSIDI